MALVNDIVTRFFINDQWRDVSTDVRAERGISYSRGRQGEDDTTPPQRCSFDLDNRDGTWSDRNPKGTYYGYLRRNLPMDVSLRVVKDTATATASNGWGSTDTATGDTAGAWQVEPWTVSGTASNYAKAAGKATHAVDAAGSSRVSYLSAFRARDVEVRFTVSLSVTNVTGTGTINIGNLMLRGQGALTAWYMLRLSVQPDETITMDWWVGQTGVSLTSGPVTVSGITHVNTNVYRVRAQAEGRVLRSKVWLDGTAEPYEWPNTIVVEDDIANTSTLRDSQGWVGIRSSISTGNTNTNITVSYDDIEILLPVFAGEISEWPQERDVTGGDRVVSIEASGIRRRLAQRGSLSRSALYNFTLNADGIAQKNPFVYWPLEGGQMTGLDNLDIMGTTSRLSFNQPNAGVSVGKISWGADTSRPGSYRAPTITGGGSLNAILEPATDGVAWAVQWQQRLNYREGTTSTFQTLSLPGGGEITVTTGQSAESVTFAVGLAAPGVAGIIMSHDFDSPEQVDEWHTLAVSAEVLPSFPFDTTFFLYVDGVAVDSHDEIGLLLAPLTYIGFASLPDSSGDISIGHVTVYSGDLGAWDFLGAETAAQGYPGDAPVWRAYRLSTEYDFDLIWYASEFIFATTDGRPMGSQRVAPLASLLDDCEIVDGGLLYEQKTGPGIVFRDLMLMLSRTPFLTLDMGTSKHLSPPLKATTDDRGVVNSATAQRADGGEWTFEQNDGPLGTAPVGEGGIGEYPKSITFNAQLETDLPDLAAWAVAKGTIDQERYPGVRVELHRPSVYGTSGLLAKLRDLDPGELITLDGLESQYVYDAPDTLVLGIRGHLNKFAHTLTLNTVPGEVYRTLTIGSTAGASSEFSRLDSNSTWIDEDLDATETGVTIEVDVGSAFWVNSTDHAAHFPFDIVIGGEQMTVTACTAPSGQNQTMTVTRNVNGLPGGKTHLTNARVSLYRPNYYGL